MSRENYTVSTEAVAFEALKRLAQDVYDTHGLRIESVHISWQDLSTTDQAAYTVRDVDATMGRRG